MIDPAICPSITNIKQMLQLSGGNNFLLFLGLTQLNAVSSGLAPIAPHYPQ